jgi:hypothetical protein
MVMSQKETNKFTKVLTRIWVGMGPIWGLKGFQSKKQEQKQPVSSYNIFTRSKFSPKFIYCYNSKTAFNTIT